MNNASPITAPAPDKANIQGLILQGYSHPYSTHFMFKFNDKDIKGIPAFINELMPYLSNAENWYEVAPFVKPAYMLNIGFTWGGVQIIHPNYNAAAFTQSFTNGPASFNSQFNLNDTGPSVPDGWWGKNFNQADVHCVVHAYALTSNGMDTIANFVAQATEAGGTSVTELFPMAGMAAPGNTDGRLRQSQLPPNYIHFGYRDGIDEPDLTPTVPEMDPSDLSYFLIGYNAKADTTYGVPPSPTPNTPIEYGFAKNGCYNAFRILSQDVGAFENFLTEKAKENAASIPQQPNQKFPTQEAYAREWLAGKVNGRWRDGTPMTMSPNTEDETQVENTTFKYNTPAVNEPDMKGLKCPFSAHTRVGNPRDEGVHALAAPVSRLSRRGMPYGLPYDPQKPDSFRGLIGMFLCGDIATQFEKLYAWINFNNFSDVFPGGAGALSFTQDALIANRTYNKAAGGPRINNSFTIPLESGKPIKIANLPQFVTTVGTAYCILPSISSLKDIAEGKIG